MKHSKTDYRGGGALALTTRRLELVVTTAVGPRIISLRSRAGKGGNLFLELPASQPRYHGYHLRGGHRLWHAPEDIVRSYQPDDEPVRVDLLPGGVGFTQAAEPKTGLQKALKLEAIGEGTLKVTHTLANRGLWAVECAPWALTMFRRGGYAVLPLPPKGSHEGGDLLPTSPLIPWSFTDLSQAVWDWHRDFIGVEVAKARSAQKLGLTRFPGWAAYWNDGATFVKFSRPVAGATYPDLGSRFEVFTNGAMIELETLGPLARLAPGRSTAHVEFWTVFEKLARPSTDRAFAELAARVKRWLAALPALTRAMPPLRLVFLGSDPIALPLLDWLEGEGRAVARVAAVFTQPDRASGRGQQVRPNAIKTWAAGRGLPVFQPEKLTEAAEAQLRALAPDVALVMAYGHILRESFIAIPRIATVNLHASLLPKYRGASPIQTALACGERVLGVSLMRIVRALDAGPVADTERFPAGDLDTAAEAEAKMAAACIPLLARGLPRLARGDLSFAEQDAFQASYCRRLVKEDGALDFHVLAPVLAARINGLFPWPACTIEIEGQQVILGQADALAGPAAGPARHPSPGTVLGSDPSGLLLVATAAGVLRLRRLQRPGGKMLSAPEFLRGHPVPAGSPIPSRPMSALVSSTAFR